MEKEQEFLGQYEKKKKEKEILEEKLHIVIEEVKKIAHEGFFSRLMDIIKKEESLEKKIENLEMELKKVSWAIDNVRDRLRELHSKGFDDND